MPVHPRVVYKRRETITALPLYYSGHLLKKEVKEKDFKKYYGELRGATLFLYKDDTQESYTEKVDLEQLKSMDLMPSYERKTPAIFTLTLHAEEVQLKMENTDTGEEWRGYILTVVKKEIPSQLRLLPGQMIQLQETLAQEKRRSTPLPRPPLPPRPSFLHSASASVSSPSPEASDLPACFFDVNRETAEKMLEENPQNGSIILRPSTLPNNYAVTLRQQMSSGPVMKNYRVASTNAGFVIELETAVTVSSLNNVLKYFVEKTDYRLHPYVTTMPYDTRIEPSPPPKCVTLPSPTPKTVPKVHVSPMLRSQTKEELRPPPTEPDESEYLFPDDDKPYDHKLKIVGELEGELRRVLKLRRANIYTPSDE